MPLGKAFLKCQTFGGTIPLPETNFEVRLMIEAMKKHMKNTSENSMMMLLPLKKDLHNISTVYQYTGAWQYHLDKVEPPWLEWAPGQPNGGVVESCVGVDATGDTPAVYDIECDKLAHSLCKVEKITVFRVRGMCDMLEQIFDTKYFVNFENTGKGNNQQAMVWEGFTQSSIEYDQRF